MMQQFLVILVLVLYVAFSFTPVTTITILSRTLFLSPGEMLTVLLIFWLFFKTMLQGRRSFVVCRPLPLIHFFYAYILLALTFLLPTLLFYVQHNEMADNMPRSLLFYSRWLIALILFYYGSDSKLRLEDLRRLVWLLMGTFVAAVIVNMNGHNIVEMVINTFSSQYMRLSGGFFPDPNQLGEIAALFLVIGLMGTLCEKKRAHALIYFMLTSAMGIIVLMTQSRESLVTFFVAVLGIIFFLLKKKRYVKALVMLSGLLAGAVFVVLSIPRVEETILSFSAGDTSYALNARDETWRLAWQTLWEYPWGIGYENLFYLNDGVIEQAHNAFLQAALVGGVFGFLVFLCFLGLLFRLLWLQRRVHPDNWMLEAYFAFLLGYIASSMASDHFITFIVFNAIFFGLLGFTACAR